MPSVDKELGERIRLLLVERGIETPMQPQEDIKPSQGVQEQIAEELNSILDWLGLDLSDDSLKDTPKRVAKMFCEEIFGGLDYDNFPKCTAIVDKLKADEIVCVRDITIRSTCEHHLQPIYGVAHIAYIPNGKILGLSKFARVASFFASRPQVQERLTEQVYYALADILETEDVAVFIKAEHYCMKMRGVKEANSTTVTSKLGGRFRKDPAARQEVLRVMGV